MFSLTSDGADQLLTVSNIVLVIGTVITLSATVGTILASSVRDKYATIRQAETDLAVASAASVSKLADARAAEANLAAAQANERSVILESNTADLLRRAAEAEAETARVNERLRKLQEVRKLPPEKREKLKSLLNSDIYKKGSGVRIMVHAVLDSDAMIYAQDFVDLFVSCGIRTNPEFDGKKPTPFPLAQISELDYDLALAVHPVDFERRKPEFLYLENLMFDLGIPIAVHPNPDIELNDSNFLVFRKLKTA